MSISLNETWLTQLRSEFQKDYMVHLKTFLKNELDQKKIIYPKGSDYFSALNLTPFDQVKVVIVGQDPYHGPGQAHGLCFSVKDPVPPPPSLENIFKELASDLGVPRPKSGDLTHWAKQGVLLLNSVLTVEAGKAGAHQGKGWETFTDEIISRLNRERSHLVFILWGSYAQKKAQQVDRGRHLVLTSAHPSPLSSYRGFFGSKPFSKTNEYLLKNGIAPIDWGLAQL